VLTLIVIGLVLVLAIGGVVKVVTDRLDITEGRITKAEFTVGALLCALVIVPGVTFTGVAMAKSSALSYNEYWSGFEVAADVQTIPCSQDGPCKHEYDCDGYLVTTMVTVSDGKGGTTTTPETHTEYHDCPYVTEEYVYTVTDSLGDSHVLGDHWWPTSPDTHRWTGRGYNDPAWGFGAPGTPGDVPTGEPALWRAAKDRINDGHPGGVTKVAQYDNFIMASQTTILRQYSGAIDKYRADGLLPTPVKGVHDHYLADKTYFVGGVPGDAAAWQESLARFNGALGSEKQGDLHLILVTGQAITDPDEYASAIQGHWQSPELGDNALSKNGVVVILGSTDGGKTVAWARAFTGMPKGNEAFTVSVREHLVGATLTPQALLGDPRATFANGEVAVEHTHGALEDVLYDTDTGFVREQMKGFAYLSGEIQPGTGAKIAILTVASIASLFVWGGLLILGEIAHHPLRRRDPLALRSRAAQRAATDAAVQRARDATRRRASHPAPPRDPLRDIWAKRNQSDRWTGF
jgi:hypothetical protein